MDHNPAPVPADLGEYIAIVRRRKWTLLIVTSLVVVGVVYLAHRQTPIYSAHTKILVNSAGSSGGQSGSNGSNLSTEEELIQSQIVAKVVQNNLKENASIGSILGGLSVETVPDANVLVIRYEDPDPVRAARLAGAFATGYLEYRTQQALDQYQAQAALVATRIAAIRRQLAPLDRKILSALPGAELDSLQTQRDALVATLGVLQQRVIDLQTSEANTRPPGEILQPSSVPSKPIRPKPVRDGLLALFLGLGLGLGAAFLREHLDDRVQSRHEVERALGASLIGAVPAVTGWRKADEARLIMRADPMHPVSEAYRTLATSVQYIGSQRQLKVLLVTSAVGSEGKTTTASNLAVALAQAGKRVVLVSADLRRPRLHRFFNLTNETGLSTVLSDSTGVAEAIKAPDISNLRILPSGPIPPNPAELLAGRRAAAVLESLRQLADIVIVDTPPMLAVADASILAPISDGALLVINANRAGRAALEQVRNQLDNAGADIIGAVYNNFEPGAGAAYPYNYKYYYQYYGTENGSPNGGWKARRQSRKARKAQNAQKSQRAITGN